tara:strand:+ start:972 stop:1640 length:669 start_codon:yes stop_codon:yes gene_type:complete
MDLKNIKLEDIKLEDIKAKLLGMADKKTLIKFGVSFGAIIIFLIIYYSILNPIVNTKKAQLVEMNSKQEEIINISNKIQKNKKKIKDLKPKYEQYSTLFHTRAEVEDLYQTLSYHAEINGLVISRIEKMKIEEVSKSEALGEGKAKKSKKKKKENIAYYTIPVNFEIRGDFLGYIKFKRALSLSKKMLNFDKELIKVVNRDATGAIVANGTLTIVGLTDEFF